MSKEIEDTSLAMSDEDFMNSPPPFVYEESESTDQEEIGQEEETEYEEEEQEEQESDTEYAHESEEENEQPEGDTDSTEAPEEGDEDQEELNYEELYKVITAPFKANGKEYTIDSPEEAISLMQMGANYNKKMAAIKPSLRLLKTLEVNKLLDEDKLNYLIDLSKGNPDAISKLLSDTEFDSYSVDADAAEKYKPTSHGVSETLVDFDMIIEEIQETPKFGETAQIVSKKWDDESRTVISNNPQYLRWINEHVHNGVYDRIASVVEKERILGKLEGVSDIAAYTMIGDQMDKAGAFNDLVQGGQEETAPRKVRPNNKAKQEKARQKKRAVSSPTSVTTAPVKEEFNPLAMSDDDFAKLFENKFI